LIQRKYKGSTDVNDIPKLANELGLSLCRSCDDDREKGKCNDKKEGEEEMKSHWWFCVFLLILCGCQKKQDKMNQQVINENGALALAPGELERAAEYIEKNLDKDKLDEIRANVKLEGNRWLTVQHSSPLGLHIRNMLRKGGFRWGTTVLDENWIDVVLLAIK
jgi:hypothetical protein